MKFMLTTLLTILASASALGAGVEHKSPFFVDGIVCEGLEGQDYNQTAVRRNFDESDKEIADLAVKNLEQSVCDSIFSRFGVEKFQWVSSDSIEQLSFNLKKSRKFEEVDIRLEKSELQNHVYLVGKFKAFEPENYYRGKLSTELYRAGDAGSSRMTTNLDLQMEIDKQGRENIAPYVIGIKTMRTEAREPLLLSQWDKESSNQTVDSSLGQYLSRPTGQYNALNFRMNPKGTLGVNGIFFAFEVSNSKLNYDESYAAGSKIELGWQLDTFNRLLPHRKFEFSILRANYFENGAQIVKKEEDGESKKDHETLFAGFTDEMDSSKFFNYKIKAYRALSKEIRYFYDIDFTFTLGELLGVTNKLGVDIHKVRGAVLPEHRFGFANGQSAALFYQGERNFVAFGAANKAHLTIGTKSYGNESESFGTISRDTNYAEIGVDTMTKNMDVGLAFTYGGRRVY